MSDTDGFGPPGPPPPTGDTASVEQAVREQRERRAVASVAEQYDPAAPEPEAEPSARKIADDGVDELSPRQAGRRLTELRRAEEERAAAYRQGLPDPIADDASHRTGESARSPAEASGEQPGDPLATERAQIEAERQQLAAHHEAQQALAGLSGVEQQWAAAEQQQGARVQAVVNQFNAIYSDMTSAAALAHLQVTDPQRFAALQNDYAVVQNEAAQLLQVQQQRGAVAQQRHAVGSAEFQRVAQLHDAAWEAEHPELTRDPGKLREVQLAARDYLVGKGLSKDELALHWSGQKSFSLREKISQDILLDAVRWRMAQDRLQQSRSNDKLPPVQRPGTRQDRSESLHAEAERASHALDRTGHVRDAVRLMQAQRRLGRR